MSRVSAAAQTALDAERLWSEGERRSRREWDDAVRVRFDELAARPFAAALKSTTRAIQDLDEDLAEAMALLRT